MQNYARISRDKHTRLRKKQMQKLKKEKESIKKQDAYFQRKTKIWGKKKRT